MDASRESDALRLDAASHGTSNLEGRAVTVERDREADDFGIKAPGKAGIRAKDDARTEFDVRLAS